MVRTANLLNRSLISQVSKRYLYSLTCLSALTLTPLPSRVSFTLLLYFSLSMVGGIFITSPYVGCTQGGNFWNANKDAR